MRTKVKIDLPTRFLDIEFPSQVSERILYLHRAWPSGRGFRHKIRMRAFSNHFRVDDAVAGYDLTELTYFPIRSAGGDVIKHFLTLNDPAERRRVSIKLGRCN